MGVFKTIGVLILLCLAMCVLWWACFDNDDHNS